MVAFESKTRAPKGSEQIGLRERDLLLQAYKDESILLARLMLDIGIVKDALDAQELKQKLTAKQFAAYERMTAVQTQNANMDAWPAGPLGEQDQAIANFFEQHLPETFRLNGRQKFFLYLLAKSGGEIHRDKLVEFTSRFAVKFPGMAGSPALLAESELETLGFVSRETPGSIRIRLTEPFYSRLRALQIP